MGDTLPPDDQNPGLEHAGAALAAFEVCLPATQTAPVVFASPHSGRNYPAGFLAASRLDAVTLRRSEDAFVDQLFAAAPGHGSPLLGALFPRAYVDPNRESFELDPAMFEDPLPGYVNTRSPRVAAGLGTVARVVASGEEIYRRKLVFADALRRIDTLYRPYHRALQRLVEATRRRFGACLVVDCHSMPSVGGPMDSDRGATRVDVVLGDCHGSSCSPAVIAIAERAFAELGLVVRRNETYAGGFTTRHYGVPAEGVHALQIEINRALYMDEISITPTPAMTGFADRLRHPIAMLASIDAATLADHGGR